MNIIILSHPQHANYGGILQAYALQTVLERMGHRVRVVNRDFTADYKWRDVLTLFAKRLVLKSLGRGKDLKLIDAFRNPWWHYKGSPRLIANMDVFCKQYIHQLDIRSLQELNREDCDAIVVGSDQVWRPKYICSMYQCCIEDAFLKFADGRDIRRVAYAPSFGTSDWEFSEAETRRCGELLRNFDAVSVREADGVDACREHFGVDALHVLDPTMLLDAEDYIKLFQEADAPQSEGTLLNYVLDEDEEKTAVIDALAGQRNLKPFRMAGDFMGYYRDVESKPAVEAWLRGFHDARMVVTDSFHACVFSILFRKPFAVIGNKERGLARFESLLNLFGLEDRMVTTPSDALSLGDIDYDAVYCKLDKMRELSIGFLTKALK